MRMRNVSPSQQRRLRFFQSRITFRPDTLNQMFDHEIDKISADPNGPDLPPHPIIYRNLLDAASYKGRKVPSRASLLEEAITLVIAGTDTTGATMTIGTYEICNNPSIYQER